MRYRDANRLSGIRGALLGATILSCALPLAAQAAPLGQDSVAAASGVQQASSSPTLEGAEDAQASAQQDIVVTGYRRSLANAAANKRSQTNFTDSIFAEDIGKFPDLNIAESLQRVPGVQLTRDVTGEGTQISVRGLGPSFTKVLLNGSQIAVASAGPLDSGSSDREVDLDLFPTELFTKLTVSKTPTADLLEGGIAGTVNMVNVRPFDKPGTHLSASFEEGYSDPSGKWSPRGSLIYSTTSDKFGILLGVAGASLHYRTDGYETIGFTTPNLTKPAIGDCTTDTCDRVGLNGGPGGGGFKFPTTVPANTGFGLTPGAPLDVSQTSGLTDQQLSNTLVPRLAREAFIDGTRDRVSALVSMEYRPSDTLHFALDALYGHAHRQYNRLDMDLYVRNSNSLVPIDWQVDDNGVLTKGTFANAQFFLEARPVTEKINFISVNPSASWRPTDTLKIDAQVNYNRSTYHQSANSFLFYTPANSGLSVTFDNTGDKDFPVMTSSADLNDPNLGWYDDNSTFRIQQASRTTTDKGAHLDLKWGDDRNNIQAGYAYDDTARSILAFDNSDEASTEGLAAITNVGQYLEPGPTNLLSGSGQTVGISSFVQPNYGALEAAANTKELSRTAPLSATGTQNTPSGSIDEATHGLYLAFNGETRLLGHELRVNAGLRYFHTDQTVRGYVTTAAGVSQTSQHSSYDGFLPSFNAAFNITHNLLLRIAGSRTVTRPNPNLLLPGTTFSDVSAQTASQGNPDLKAYYSNNADIGLEYYTGGTGYFSVNFFNKDIQGFTQVQQVTEPFSALGIPLDSLSPVQLATGIGPDTLINVNTSENVGQNLNIQGEEIILQQPLDFLTHLISSRITGFGISANYSHIKQRSNGSAAVATGIAPNLYPLGGYYEDSRLSVHVNYTYTDKAIVAIAPQNNVDVANIMDSHGQLDLSASYTLPLLDNAIQLSFNAINLTNAPLRTYAGYENAPFSVYYPGSQYLFGLRVHF
jgi:TonB-dependent receptor